MQKSVANLGFMNITHFWIANTKMIIRRMLILTRNQIFIKSWYFIEQMLVKILNIFLVSLASDKILPGFKQILQRNNFFKRYNQFFSHMNHMSPPPDKIRRNFPF